MSQAKNRVRPGLPEVIKSIRQRKHINTTELAHLLGVTQGQVSRYESGKAVPGYLPLSRLFELSEGIERNIILDQIAEWKSAVSLRTGLELTEQEVRAGVEWLANKTGSRVSDEVWREILTATPSLAQLVEIVGGLLLRRREVDSSVVQIVLDWADQADDADPVIRECFRDAAEYLEYLLDKRTGSKGWRREGREDTGDQEKQSEQGRRSA